MSKDLNKVMLIGRLGQDPELKYTPSGIAVANFTMATNLTWKDADGKLQERTEWHNIKAWRGLAETCANYLKRGSRVYVEGRLETSSWEDDTKTKRYKTEIIIDDLIMLSPKDQTERQESDDYKKRKDNYESIDNNNDDLPF
jgi:single-strand DNA-binding protein